MLFASEMRSCGSRRAQPSRSSLARLLSCREKDILSLMNTVANISEPIESQETFHPTDGWRRPSVLPSLPEVFRTIKVPKGASWLRRLFAFVGPGYLVAVGYMDPGNWATDIAGG